MPHNAPGAVNERKFPTMAAAGLTQNAPGKTGGSKAKVNAANNAYANLQMGSDSEEEEERLARPALLAKEKGAKQLAPKGDVSAEITLTELQMKERDEKARKLAEKEEAKKKAREEAKRTMEEAKKSAKGKLTKETNGNFVQADDSKFKYGLFDAAACDEKYTERQKVGLAH